MEKHLYKSLDENITEIKSFFDNSVDYFEKEIDIMGHRAAIVMCEDLINITNIWQVNLRPLNNLKADFTPQQVY
ncbi:MAG: hypothetical protein IJ339_04785, partial [Oscillospiraceae bacterium]|nr:hypothetical protein [Oscillospiraceae bacterium]